MNNNKVKFDLVEQISEHRVKLKGIIGGDRFEALEEDDNLISRVRE